MTEAELDPSDSTMEQWWQQYLNRASEQEVHVDLFLRSCAPSMGCYDHQTAFIERLSEVASEGTIDSYDVSVVGNEICRSERWEQFYAGKPVETVLELASWRSGGIRATGFTERKIYSSTTGETTDTVTPPELLLAVYADDDLIGLFPCQADGQCYDPETFLDRCLSSQPDDDTDWQVAQG